MNNQIDINKIIENKIGLEAYLILYSLYTNNKQIITNYTQSCKKINTEIFRKLEEDNFITINNEVDEKIYYELLSLTEHGSELVQGCLHQGAKKHSHILENNFEEFRKSYPLIVKNGINTRRLHTDLKRSKSSYDKLLLETTHDILCKSAKLYHNEMIKSGSEYYMQNLSTWLNQANYKQYLEEAIKTNQIDNNITDQSEDI